MNDDEVMKAVIDKYFPEGIVTVTMDDTGAVWVPERNKHGFNTGRRIKLTDAQIAKACADAVQNL